MLLLCCYFFNSPGNKQRLLSTFYKINKIKLTVALNAAFGSINSRPKAPAKNILKPKHCFENNPRRQKHNVLENFYVSACEDT